MNTFSKFQIILFLFLQAMPSAAAASKVASLDDSAFRMSLPELKTVLRAEDITAGLRRNRLDGPVYVALRYFSARYSLLGSGGQPPTDTEVLELRLEVQRLLTSAESKLNQVTLSANGTVVDSVALSFEVLAQEVALAGEARRTVGELMLADLAFSPTAVYADYASQTSALRVVQRERLAALIEESLQKSETDPIFGESFQLVFERFLQNESDFCAKAENESLCLVPAHLRKVVRGEASPLVRLEFVEYSLLKLFDSVMQRSAQELEEIAKPALAGGKPLVDPRVRHETAIISESSLAIVQRLYSDSLPTQEAQDLKLLGRMNLGLYFALSELRREEGAGLVSAGLLTRVASIVAVQVHDSLTVARTMTQKARFASWSHLQPSVKLLATAASTDSEVHHVLVEADNGITALVGASQPSATGVTNWNAHITPLIDRLLLLDRARFFLLDAGYSKSLGEGVLTGDLRMYSHVALQEGLQTDDPLEKFPNLASVIEKDEALFDLMRLELSAPPWSRINLIRAIVGGRYKDGSLDIDGQPLPNIEKWTVKTAPFVRSVARDYEQVLLDPKPALTAIQELLNSADRARQVSRGLKAALASEEGSATPQAIALALDDYAQSFEILQESIVAERKKFENEKVFGLELNRPFSDQTIAAERGRLELSPNVESCPSFRFPSAEGKIGVRLPPIHTSEFVKKALAAVPEKVRTAILLGKGTLGACYENTKWVPGGDFEYKYDAKLGHFIAYSAGVPSADFALFFNGTDGVKIELGRFRIVGTKPMRFSAEGRRTYLHSLNDPSGVPFTGTQLAKEIEKHLLEKGSTNIGCDRTPVTIFAEKDSEFRYPKLYMRCYLKRELIPVPNDAVFSKPDTHGSWMEAALVQENIDVLLEGAINSVSQPALLARLNVLDAELETLRIATLKGCDTVLNSTIQTGSNALHAAAMSVAGSKALVASLLTIAMPTTLVLNEEVRFKLSRGNGLPDDSTIIKYLQSGAATIDPARTNFFKDIPAQKEALKKTLREFSLKSEAEFAQAADIQYGQLSRLKRALDLYLPARSLDDTLANLKSDLHAWAKQ